MSSDREPDFKSCLPAPLRLAASRPGQPTTQLSERVVAEGGHGCGGATTFHEHPMETTCVVLSTYVGVCGGGCDIGYGGSERKSSNILRRSSGS